MTTSDGDEAQRKDRLIQTRVPERLQSSLKQEARRRRTTVSQLIRTVLEDTFQLVDDVVENVDQLVSDSVELARQVGREGLRRGDRSDRARPDQTRCLDPLPDADQRLDAVQAWNEVVLQRPVACSRCGLELPRGERVYMGLGDGSAAPSVWVCKSSVDSQR